MKSIIIVMADVYIILYSIICIIVITFVGDISWYPMFGIPMYIMSSFSWFMPVATGVAMRKAIDPNAGKWIWHILLGVCLSMAFASSILYNPDYIFELSHGLSHLLAGTCIGPEAWPMIYMPPMLLLSTPMLIVIGLSALCLRWVNTKNKISSDDFKGIA